MVCLEIIRALIKLFLIFLRSVRTKTCSAGLRRAPIAQVCANELGWLVIFLLRQPWSLPICCGQLLIVFRFRVHTLHVLLPDRHHLPVRLWLPSCVRIMLLQLFRIATHFGKLK